MTAHVRGIGTAASSTRPFDHELLAAVQRHAAETPDRPAFINAENPAERVTFGQFHGHCEAITAFLHARGFAKGNRACVLAANCWQSTAVFVGVARVGGILSGASTAFTELELKRQFVDCEPKVVFCDRKAYPLVKKVVEEVKSVEFVVIIDLPKDASGHLSGGVVLLGAVLQQMIRLPFPLPSIDTEKDVVALPYSSGTSGTPKGVKLTHRNLSAMVNAYTWHSQTFLYPHLAADFDPEREFKLHFLPQHHVFGFVMPMIGVMHGFTNLLLPRYHPQLMLECVQKYRIKQLHVVPPIVLMLAKSPLVDRFDLRSLKTIYCGSAPLGLELIAEVKKRLGLKSVTQGYGLSECVLGTFRPTYTDPPRSAGKLIGEMEAKIVDIETGRTLDRNQSGEILLRGAMVMAGYWRNKKATAEALTADGWLHTGDIGYLDENDYLFIVDRLKELIKYNGLQIAPAELEDVLLGHPKVRDVAVIGIPNPKTGEVPRAFVVKKDASLTEEEVHNWVNDRVAAYKRLRGGVEFVDEGGIPKSISGKILRRQLRDRVRSRGKL